MQRSDINNSSYDIVYTDNPPYVRMDYEDRTKLDEILLEPELLAVMGFGDTTTRGDDDRLIMLGMPELGGRHTIEVWRAAETVVQELHEGIVVSRTGDYLFGSLVLGEDDGEIDLTDLSEDVYTRLITMIREQGYPHLLRMWNYFSHINEETFGLERYQQFCHGRHNALDKLALPDSTLPAASALGTHATGLVVCFLAAKEAGTQIENPRQVSAFCYPEQYAPRSPSFSRAVFKRCRSSARSRLYISGTASIVGHETQHVGDIEKQLDETLKNIEVLIEEGIKTQSLDSTKNSPVTSLKVYLRRPEDESLVRETLISRFGEQIQYVILHADICRQDLLIEIEGIYFV